MSEESKSKEDAAKIQSERPPTKAFPWKEVLGSLVAVLVAYMGFLGIRAQIQIPIQYTQTAEAKLPTLVVHVDLPSTDTPQPTFTSTPYPCPYHAPTDHDTIFKLIEAEAIAVNTEDIKIILEIFAPDAMFYDYQYDSPQTWEGPIKRYKDDLFLNADIRELKHFGISPAGQGVDGDTAYYTSGSSGKIKINGGDTKDFSNPPGSDHWILEKDEHGCWVIVRMEFNAKHIEFPTQ